MYNLLIVEDEELERMALKRFIKENFDNIKVVGETGCAQEAIKLDEDLNPDIILMDVNIIGCDGIEVSNKIKTRNPNKIIIILTAYDEFSFAQRAIKTRIDDYILKPVRPEKIVEAIIENLPRIKRKSIKNTEELEVLLKNISSADYNLSINSLKNYIDKIFEKPPEETEKDISYLLKKLTRIAFEYELDITENVYNLKINSLDKKGAVKGVLTIIDLIFEKMLSLNSDISGIIKKVKGYIDKNIRKNIALEYVAKYANMSIYHLSRAFKKELGINFSNYITEKKMELAKDMLINTDMPIVRIAMELSYRESNYFSKVFKKTIGVTPSEYRTAKRENIFQKNNYISNGRWYI